MCLLTISLTIVTLGSFFSGNFSLYNLANWFKTGSLIPDFFGFFLPSDELTFFDWFNRATLSLREGFLKLSISKLLPYCLPCTTVGWSTKKSSLSLNIKHHFFGSLKSLSKPDFSNFSILYFLTIKFAESFR